MSVRKQNILELRSKTTYLRDELSNLLSRWFYLKNVVFPQIDYRYNQLFGAIESEIEHFTLELRKHKMAHFKVNIQNIEYVSNSNIDNLNNCAEYIFNSVEKAFENNQIPDFSINVDYEISNLYRQLVKKLHPDTSNDIELFNKYWINVQDAYHTKNVHKLRLFHKIICFDEYLELITTRNRERVLSFELNELEKSITNEKRKINRLMNQEPFVFMNKLYDEEWVGARKDFLNKKLNNLKDRINTYQHIN